MSLFLFYILGRLNLLLRSDDLINKILILYEVTQYNEHFRQMQDLLCDIISSNKKVDRLKQTTYPDQCCV